MVRKAKARESVMEKEKRKNNDLTVDQLLERMFEDES